MYRTNFNMRIFTRRKRSCVTREQIGYATPAQYHLSSTCFHKMIKILTSCPNTI